MNIEQLYAEYLKRRDVTTDSRKVREGSIFFALKGDNFDGNRFAASALEQGAALCVIDNPECKVDDRCVVVDDVLKTLQELARYHRSQLTVPVIGITGTNGKTTTKELLAAVLSKRYRVHATQGNFNNHIGVPLTLLSMPADAEMMIVEMVPTIRARLIFCAISPIRSSVSLPMWARRTWRALARSRA